MGRFVPLLIRPKNTNNIKHIFFLKHKHSISERMCELPASFLLIKPPKCQFLFRFKNWRGAERISGILFFPVQPFTFCGNKRLQSLHLPISALDTRKATVFFFFILFFFLPSKGEGLYSILYINKKLNVATRQKWDILRSGASAASFVALQQRTTKTDNEAQCWMILLLFTVNSKCGLSHTEEEGLWLSHNVAFSFIFC